MVSDENVAQTTRIPPISNVRLLLDIVGLKFEFSHFPESDFFIIENDSSSLSFSSHEQNFCEYISLQHIN